MTRLPRKKSSTLIYHIMFRGINKQEIFNEIEDYEKMLQIIKLVKDDLPFELYAYCLMSNHVHLIIKENKLGNISIILKKILIRYSMWFNKKYNRCGHLISNRYLSIPIAVDNYFLNVIRYVHQNPVKIGKSLEYKWSSYMDYINSNNRELVDTYFVFKMINIKNFKTFNLENEKNVFEPMENVKCDDAYLETYISKTYNIETNKVIDLPKIERNRIIFCLSKEFPERQLSRVLTVSRGLIRKIKTLYKKT